jgi:hypothetical protein
MKALLKGLIGFVVLTLTAFANDSLATVRFSNKDRLTGALAGLDTEKLEWSSPLFEKPTPFFLKNVVDLALPATLPDILAKHEASASLTNGDLIRGQLISVSDTTVEMDTWFAGRVKVNRLMVKEIKIIERPNYIYRGPTALDGWKQAGDLPAWTYQNLNFRSTAVGSIAKEMNLPDECSIAFDVGWRDSLSLNLVFYSNDASKERPTNGYSMSFQHRSITLSSCKDYRGIGNTQNVYSFQENEKAHIEVRASIKSGKIAVLVDGQLLEVWTDPEVAAGGFGKAVHFATQNLSPVEISRIEVSSWDGEIELTHNTKRSNRMALMLGEDLDNDMANPPSNKEDPIKPGRMKLRNGDTIEGEVISIADGMITVKTPFKEVKLPIEALRNVTLKTVELERSKRENGDIRGWFSDGSSLVFRLESATADTIKGYSQNFGTADFKLSTFNRIEFNIHEPSFEEIRKEL